MDQWIYCPSHTWILPWGFLQLPPGIPRFARQQHLVAMDQLYRSPCRFNRGVPRERYGDVKDPPVLFCVLRFTMGFRCCAANVGMEVNEMWEMIPFLRGHEFFRKCLYCTFGHSNWDESRRKIGPVTRRINWLTFVVCFTCSQFILEKGCALVYINMQSYL